ncbi:MAG: HAMP domain-containing sensor histidine kinase [Gallionella sp.]|nr:HAMP domain-containing sensor histidine kinase [Gallionella sp.]
MGAFADSFFRYTLSDLDAQNLPVRAEQIRARLRNYPLMLASQMLVAPLLCVLMWPAVEHGLLLGWLGLVYGAHLVEFGFWLAYRRESVTLSECKRWRTRFIVFVSVIGLLWGSAGLMLLALDDLAYQALLICVILGLAAGAATINPVFPPALIIYVGLLILPVLLACLWLGDVTHYVLAAMLAVYLLFVLNAGRDLSKTFELSLWQRLENRELVAQLTDEKQHAELGSKMKSKFFAAASHDLRQPMHALTLFVDVLKHRPHDEESARLIGQIERSVEVMATMFDALLDLSKLDAGVVQPQFEDFAIQPLLARLNEEFSMLAGDKGLRFELSSCSEVLHGDPLLLERILRNLISNAIRYTERGKVSVTCERVPQGMRVQVRDSGIGIAPEQLPHIFEEYSQVGNVPHNSRHGMGLGLAIVKRLEHLLGYRIEVESKLGEGTCMALVVPLAAGSHS